MIPCAVYMSLLSIVPDSRSSEPITRMFLYSLSFRILTHAGMIIFLKTDLPFPSTEHKKQGCWIIHLTYFCFNTSNYIPAKNDISILYIKYVFCLRSYSTKPFSPHFNSNFKFQIKFFHLI